MPLDLKSIKGISTSAAKKLQALGIADGDMLRTATGTAEQRRELADKIKHPVEDIYIWSKQVELMQMDGISAADAQLLIQCGIRDIPDLVSAHTDTLLKFMKTVRNNTTGSSRLPTQLEIESWKKSGEEVAPNFQKNESDEPNEFLFSAYPLEGRKLGSGSLGSSESAATLNETAFFSDLSQVITEIGLGVAGAQHQMDLNSLEIQNMILEDEELAVSGFNATWYTIPELNFTLKMEYTMAEETTTNKNGVASTKRKMFISPSNAKYNNIFKTSQSSESTLNLRIVPVPPPERFTDRRVMPNLLGFTREAAEEELSANGITVKSIKVIKGTTNNSEATEVIYQSVPANKVLLINEQPELIVTMKNDE